MALYTTFLYIGYVYITIDQLIVAVSSKKKGEMDSEKESPLVHAKMLREKKIIIKETTLQKEKSNNGSNKI